MDEFKMCCGTTCDKRKVQEQIDALVAQVEVQRRELQSAADWFAAYWPELNKAQCDRIKQMDSVAKSTPAACLAQVRAEAGRAGFIAGTKLLMGDRETNADDYAKRLLSGGAE